MSEQCPECGHAPGHSILCQIGIDRAARYQNALENKHRKSSPPSTQDAETDSAKGPCLQSQIPVVTPAASTQNAVKGQKDYRSRVIDCAGRAKLVDIQVGAVYDATRAVGAALKLLSHGERLLVLSECLASESREVVTTGGTK